MKKLLLILLLVSMPALVFAQGLTITGKVTDTKGEPLIGASVFVKALNLGAATDFNGTYSFEIRKEDVQKQTVELTVTYVGFKKQSVDIVLTGQKLVQNFELQEDIFQSDEVVVTGIASKTSKSVAEVAVARVSAADLTAKQAYTTFSQLVSGKIAGVQIQTASGNVGGGWRFIMRSGGGLNGNEQPVIYLDGVRLNNSDLEGNWVGGQTISFLSNINPDDIENIEVLKGPSAAAMYGTSGSNGVVLITTKKGSLVQGLGKDMNISYQFNYGMNTPSFKFDADRWTNAPVINSVLSPTGYIQEHTLSISGGNALLRYYTSFQDRNEDGLIPHQNTMNRRNLRANISAYPSEKLNFQLSTSYTWNKLQRPYNDNNIIGWMLNAFSYYPAFVTTDSAAIAALQDWSYIDQFIGSAKMTWKPIGDLEIQGGFGLDFTDFRQDQLRPYGYRYSSNKTGARYIYNRQAYRFTYDINARYNLDILENLHLTTIVGAQLLDRDTRSNDAGAIYFNHPDITTIQTGAQMSYMDNDYTFGREAGIFWENSFSYDNTYFWTLAVRKDYANSIGTEAPSIMYPKFSGAVRLDKFDFLPNEISLFKLRAAYGESGILPGRLDAIPLTWTASAAGNGVGVVGNSLGNVAIEPERIKEFEIGFDSEFLQMFSLEFTYYMQNASKSIVYSALAPSYGFGGLTYPFNIGKVTSHGFESMLQINPIRTADYDLSLSFIWNYQTSKIEDLGNTTELTSGQNVEKVGFKKHEFYSVRTTTPIYSSTTQKLIGYNNTGSKVDCGSPIPDHSGSFSVNFRFLKNFNFYASAEFGLNNYVYSYTFYRGIRAGSSNFANRYATQLGVVGLSAFPGLRNDPNVTPLTPGTPEYNKAAEEFAQYYYRDQGNFIFPADFFIIREVSLSYDFTELMKSYMPNNYVSNFVAGFSVRNLFRTSKYEFDFESNYTGGSSAATYASDFATLPQPRTYNFWVKFGL